MRTMPQFGPQISTFKRIRAFLITANQMFLMVIFRDEQSSRVLDGKMWHTVNSSLALRMSVFYWYWIWTDYLILVSCDKNEIIHIISDR